MEYVIIPFIDLTYFQFLTTSKSLPSTESVSFLMVELRTEVADSIIAIFGDILLSICINHKFSMDLSLASLEAKPLNKCIVHKSKRFQKYCCSLFCMGWSVIMHEDYQIGNTSDVSFNPARTRNGPTSSSPMIPPQIITPPPPC